MSSKERFQASKASKLDAVATVCDCLENISAKPCRSAVTSADDKKVLKRTLILLCLASVTRHTGDDCGKELDVTLQIWIRDLLVVRVIVA